MDLGEPECMPSIGACVMKILIATMPFAGHIGPLTSIAERLVALGHEVAWYIAPALAPRV